VGVVAVRADGRYQQPGGNQTVTVRALLVCLFLLFVTAATRFDLVVEEDGRATVVARQHPVSFAAMAFDAHQGRSAPGRVLFSRLEMDTFSFDANPRIVMTLAADSFYILKIPETVPCRVGFRHVGAGWVSSVAVVTIHARSLVNVLGEAFFRYEQTLPGWVPTVGVPVTLGTGILVQFKLGAVQRLRREVTRAGCDPQHQQQMPRKSAHLGGSCSGKPGDR